MSCGHKKTVAVRNHNSVQSSSTALLVVRGDCVLPRFLVGERSLHWSLTGFHGFNPDDGGARSQLPIFNGNDLPLAELIVCHEHSVFNCALFSGVFRFPTSPRFSLAGTSVSLCHWNDCLVLWLVNGTVWHVLTCMLVGKQAFPLFFCPRFPVFSPFPPMCFW